MFHLDKIIFYDGFISFAPTSPNGGQKKRNLVNHQQRGTQKSALKHKFTAKTDSLQPCK